MEDELDEEDTVGFRCVSCGCSEDGKRLRDVAWRDYAVESEEAKRLRELHCNGGGEVKVCLWCHKNLLSGKTCLQCGRFVHKYSVGVTRDKLVTVKKYICQGCGMDNEHISWCAMCVEQKVVADMRKACVFPHGDDEHCDVGCRRDTDVCTKCLVELMSKDNILLGQQDDGMDQCLACEKVFSVNDLKYVKWDDFEQSDVIKALREHANVLGRKCALMCAKCRRNLRSGMKCVECCGTVYKDVVQALNRCIGKRQEYVCASCGHVNIRKKMCGKCGVECNVQNMRNVSCVMHADGGTCDECPAIRKRVCWNCYRKLNAVYDCTCCHQKRLRKDVLIMNISAYDGSDYIVNSALGEGSPRKRTGGTEYICKNCHHNLVGKKQKVPKMPQNAAVRACSDAGLEFQRAIRQKPEFACTCCHRWCFQKRVLKFDAGRYNFEKKAVGVALADDMRYKMNVKVYKGEWCAHTHTIPFDVYDVDVEVPTGQDDVPSDEEAYEVIHVEYICDTCHRYLTRKKPVVPPMACANGLKLDEVPPELSELTDLERRLVCLRIPFMSIFCVRTFGSQKKIQGGCTNVPTRLGQIADMLPRMSSEVELHAMMIKRKMAYKKAYMENKIRKDVVMRALHWLLQNNEQYRDIVQNEKWFDDWVNSDFGGFICGVEGDSAMCNKIGRGDGGRYDDVTGVEGTGVREVDDEVDECDGRTSEEIAEDVEAAAEFERLHGPPDVVTVEPECMENEVYACAPGENMTPKYMLLDEHFEELAFPDMFPLGCGGYHGTCGKYTKISLRQYYQQRLLNVDGRFGKSVEYLFCAQFGADIKQLQGNAYLALRLNRGKTKDGRKVTAGMLRNSDEMRQLGRRDESYKVLKTLRGSPPYWQHQMYELMAMLRTLGKPTFFMTLSAADMYWREMLEATAIEKHEHLSHRAIRHMSLVERSERLKASPTLAARMFLYRVDTFFDTYLKHESEPLGKIVDSVCKIEFQLRGAPHVHSLLWVKDAPRAGIDSDDAVVTFIDRYISGTLPECGSDGDLMRRMVVRFQKHKHSSTCRRKHKCRFDFPKAPSPKTLIARSYEDEEGKSKVLSSAKGVINKVQAAMDSEDSLDVVLERAGVSEAEYIDAISLCRSGQKVVLRRSPGDVCVNNYNSGVLRYWGANIDLQYVLDEYSTVMYVCSYMMKAEKEMGEVLRAVSRECAAEPIKAQLKKIGQVFMGKRVVGATEAAMRVLSYPLIKKTRQMRYIDGNMPDCRISLPKPLYQLKRMEEDEEDVFMKSWHDRYKNRPDALEDMCFAKFGAAYDPVYEKRDISVGDDDDGDSKEDVDGDVIAKSDESEVIHLKGDMGRMRKRRKEAVPQVKYYKEHVDAEQYYYARLMLYTAWRSEEELLGSSKTYAERYEVVKADVECNAAQFNLHADTIDAAMAALNTGGAPETVWDMMAPNAQEDNINAGGCGLDVYADTDGGGESTGSLDNRGDVDGKGDSENSKAHLLGQLYKRVARKDILEPGVYRHLVRSLNEKQREMVMFNRRWCKEVVKAVKSGRSTEGYKVFLSGCGGTGKSYVIQLIHHDVNQLLGAVIQPDADQPLVMLTAPTGTAAFNIDGITMHSALQLPVGKKRDQILALDGARTHTMQNRLAHLQLLVVDEVSMVGRSTFQQMSARLGVTKFKDDVDWGGVSILAVGDLMQLNPIGQGTVYRGAVAGQMDELSPMLWDDFKFHELDEVMRQRDPVFAAVLGAIRMKEPGENTVEDKILRGREIIVDETHEDYPLNIVHVYARNKYCTLWNNGRLDALSGDIVECVAVDRRTDGVGSLANVSLPKQAHLTGNLYECVRVKVQARVMLTSNLDVRDGLTNGAIGTVVGFQYKENEVISIMVQFDNERVGVLARAGVSQRAEFSKAVAVPRVEVSFGFMGRQYIRVSRTQFPLMLAWAVTIHKVQGATMDGIVVEMSAKKGYYQAGQAYVAFSRVKRLQDLYILNYDREQIKVNEKAVGEMRRTGKEELPHIPVPLVERCGDQMCLRICHLNVRHLASKLDDISACKTLKHMDVICFTETKLEQGQRMSAAMLGLSIDEYVVYRMDRNRYGGGVMMCVARRLLPARVHGLGVKAVGFEHIVVEVCLGPDIVRICVVYKPPVVKVNEWLGNMRKIIERYDGCKLCIVGDMNEDLLDKVYVSRHSVNKLLIGEGFNQHVASATTDRGSLLDHVYSRNICGDAVHTEVIDCYYSDHDIVSCVVLANEEQRRVKLEQKVYEDGDGMFVKRVNLDSEDVGEQHRVKLKRKGDVNDHEIVVKRMKSENLRKDVCLVEVGTGDMMCNVDVECGEDVVWAGVTGSESSDIVCTGVTGAQACKYRPLSVEEREVLCRRYNLFERGQITCGPLSHCGVGSLCMHRPVRIKAVGGDGNCLFRAFAYLLSGSEENYAVLRAYICDYVCDVENWVRMRAYCVKYSTGAPYASGIAYVEGENMFVDGVWGTHVECYAFAQMTGHDIEVYVDVKDEWRRFCASGSRTDISGRALYLEHINGNHYNAVLGV